MTWLLRTEAGEIKSVGTGPFLPQGREYQEEIPLTVATFLARFQLASSKPVILANGSNTATIYLRTTEPDLQLGVTLYYRGSEEGAVSNGVALSNGVGAFVLGPFNPGEEGWIVIRASDVARFWRADVVVEVKGA